MGDRREPTDAMFMSLASQSGGIQPLLRTFFSFLHRNTDFYVVDDNPRRPMGFGPGDAERMVLRAFKEFPMKVTSTKAAPAPAAPAPAATKPAKFKPGKSGKPAVAAAAAAPTAAASPSAAAAPPPPAASPPADLPAIRYTEDGKQVPIGNGGIGPNYWWTQNLYEATVYMDLPTGVRSRDVEWKVTPKTVRLAVKGQDTALLEGELGNTVKPGDCMWSIEDGKTFVLSFDKATHTWWRSVVAGHPEIDTTKVDSTRKVEEYDDETQAAIRKIMYDQQRKAAGLPTSEEDAVAAAMAAPGSPFVPGGLP